MYSENAIKAFSDLIVQEIQPDKIILFGSYAYGLPTESSDLDLLVIKNVTGQTEFSIEEEAKLNYRILNRKRSAGLKLKGDIFLMTDGQARESARGGEGAIADALRRGVLLYENSIQQESGTI